MKAKAARIQRIIELLADGHLTAREISRITDTLVATIRKDLTRMRKAGLIIAKGNPKNLYIYALPDYDFPDEFTAVKEMPVMAPPVIVEPPRKQVTAVKVERNIVSGQRAKSKFKNPRAVSYEHLSRQAKARGRPREAMGYMIAAEIQEGLYKNERTGL